jgi:subtilisin-like proprotein convertase family protein
MLAANGSLRWDQVKDLLARACDQIDPAGGNYKANGHSDLYGYGRLNAETAIRVARRAGEIAPTSPTDESPEVDDDEPSQDRPYTNSYEVEAIEKFGRALWEFESKEATLEVQYPEVIDSVRVIVAIEDAHIDSLVLTLIPPFGSRLDPVILHRGSGELGRVNQRFEFDRMNTPALADYHGVSCEGTWTLRIRDSSPETAGRLLEFGMYLDPNRRPDSVELDEPPTFVRSASASRAQPARKRAAK